MKPKGTKREYKRSAWKPKGDQLEEVVNKSKNVTKKAIT